MKTLITKIQADWTDVKNECRNTMNKSATNVPATDDFILNVLISEHSPIRLVKIKWSWKSIKSWISVHFARHWLGWDKWVSTQRTDRTGVDRNAARQDAPVDMDIEANAQSLINVSRYRLCYQASPETRGYMEDLKEAIKESGQTQLSSVMVPNCVYRMGCPEFDGCPFFQKFYDWCESKGFNLGKATIRQRYEWYNTFFYERRKLS